MTPTLQQILLDHVKAENAHDMQATLATLHPECVFEDTATGQVFHGREGAALHYRQWWEAFNLVFSRGAQGSGRFTTDGAYVAEGLYSGRHTGPFLGLPATGRELEFRFAVFVSFRDGLLAAERFYYDLAGVLRQLAATERDLITLRRTTP